MILGKEHGHTDSFSAAISGVLLGPLYVGKTSNCQMLRKTFSVVFNSFVMARKLSHPSVSYESCCEDTAELLSFKVCTLPEFMHSMTLAAVQKKPFTIAMDCFQFLSRLGTNILSFIKHTDFEIPFFPTSSVERFSSAEKNHIPQLFGFCCPPTASQDSR